MMMVWYCEKLVFIVAVFKFGHYHIIYCIGKNIGIIRILPDIGVDCNTADNYFYRTDNVTCQDC